MNIVSFSLWGPREYYYRGVFANYELIQKLLPGFRMVVHVDVSYPGDRVEKMRELGVDVVPEPCLGPYHGAFWRFFSCEYPGIVLMRDVDSRISAREVGLVYEWIESGKKFHIIRDFKSHVLPIGAGLWGCRGGIPNIRYLSMRAVCEKYADDEKFLETHVFPMAKENCLEHTSNGLHLTNCYRDIEKLPDGTYIGQRHDENDQPFG